MLCGDERDVLRRAASRCDDPMLPEATDEGLLGGSATDSADTMLLLEDALGTTGSCDTLCSMLLLEDDLWATGSCDTLCSMLLLEDGLGTGGG